MGYLTDYCLSRRPAWFKYQYCQNIIMKDHFQSQPTSQVLYCKQTLSSLCLYVRDQNFTVRMTRFIKYGHVYVAICKYSTKIHTKKIFDVSFAEHSFLPIIMSSHSKCVDATDGNILPFILFVNEIMMTASTDRMLIIHDRKKRVLDRCATYLYSSMFLWETTAEHFPVANNQKNFFLWCISGHLIPFPQCGSMQMGCMFLENNNAVCCERQQTAFVVIYMYSVC